MDKIIEQVDARYGRAKAVADQWSDLLEACFYYAVPFRNRFYQPKEFQGGNKNSRVYDTTAVESTKTFVSKLHDAMTPPQVQWGYLDLDETFEQFDEDDRDEAQAALDTYMRKLFAYIHRSNFDVVINECYFDLAIGTSALVVNSYREDDPLLFTSIPIDKLAIEESFNGRIETWFRTWDDIKISELKLRWKNAKLSTDMERDLKHDKDAKIKCIKEGCAFFPDEPKPYCYIVWANGHAIVKEWLTSNPGIVWRFQKTNNETWGRGPVMDALPSIISLQELARIELASANLNTFRPYMAFSDGVFNPHTFKLEPFSVIPIAPIGSSGQFPLQPLPDSSNPNFSQLQIQDLRNQVKVLLFAETTEAQSIQPETATEVMLKQQELSQKIGPLFSRLQQEFLWPVIRRCADVLDKMGMLPMPRLNDRILTFKYKSPLALTKGQQDASRVTQYAQMLQGLVGPEATQMYINLREAPWLLASALQIDSRYLNNKEQVEQAAQEVAQRQAMLAQAQEEAGQQPEG